MEPIRLCCRERQGNLQLYLRRRKIALLRHVSKVVEKRVPIIMGTGSNNTYASIELTKKAEQNGADAIMLVAPYYSKTNQEGLYQHFKAIAYQYEAPCYGI